jgi:hypothetical protein
VGSGIPISSLSTAHSSSDFRPLGFEANLKFEPQLGALPGALDDTLGPEPFKAANRTLGLKDCGLRIYDYRHARDLMQQFATPPCVLVGFDNSRDADRRVSSLSITAPRRLPKRWTQRCAPMSSRCRRNELIFINAWNEWAEGNRLEPDLVNGLGHLKAMLQVKNLFPRIAAQPSEVPERQEKFDPTVGG